MMATDPSAAACRVRGLEVPPSRRPPPVLPTHRASERPWALPFKAFSSTAGGPPLGGRALLTLPGRISAPPGGYGEDRAAFRALVSRRVRAATGLPKESDRRCLPGILPSRAFPPSARANACSHDADPLALEREDVITRLGLRVSRIGWIGLVRLRTAGSPGVSHLATVAVLRSSNRGAGVWVDLAQEAAQNARLPERS
jgi:hypothetical protein